MRYARFQLYVLKILSMRQSQSSNSSTNFVVVKVEKLVDFVTKKSECLSKKKINQKKKRPMNMVVQNGPNTKNN